jgi:hypothetical protein
LGQELYCLLRHPLLRNNQRARFDAVRATLRQDAGRRAAQAIQDLLGR